MTSSEENERAARPNQCRMTIFNEFNFQGQLLYTEIKLRELQEEQVPLNLRLNSSATVKLIEVIFKNKGRREELYCSVRKGSE